MATYLVTGGAGFIGSHLVDALTARGDRVRVLDNFSTGRRDNLRGLAGAPDIVEGDLGDQRAVAGAVRGVEGIFHQGALPSVPRSLQNPLASHQVNATGTLHLLVAAREAGVQRVVYASSSSVYGDTPTLPTEEGMPPQPRSPYAVTKLAGEHYCRVFTAAFGLETVCLRYFNVFGPRQDPTSQYAAVIPAFIEAAIRGEAPTVFGDGTQSRDFTYVGNVVAANLLAMEAAGIGGEVFNIGCGDRHTLLDLLAALEEILEVRIRPRFAPPRPGDVRHSQAAIGKAERRLGYRPLVPFREGLRRTAAWLRDRRGSG